MNFTSCFSFFASAILMFSCTKNQEMNFTVSDQEQFRPDYHFTPSKGWMNDPNGMVYVDGVYHFFYQKYPYDTSWGPMHWGHATSRDLIHWEHQPIALYPDELGFIFSGSAVYDTQNSSEYGTNENPPIIAI